MADIAIAYLYVDGVAKRLHLASGGRQCRLPGASTLPGIKHLLSILPGTKEDTASCRDFLCELKARGMRDRILIEFGVAPRGSVQVTRGLNFNSLQMSDIVDSRYVFQRFNIVNPPPLRGPFIADPSLNRSVWGI